jgi:hypothetical protein
VSLRDRISKLVEARQRRRPDHLPVLTLRPGESVVAGQERAAASGFVTIGLVVPAILSVEEWERMAIQQQAELTASEAVLQAEHPPVPTVTVDPGDRSGTPRPAGFVEVGSSQAVYRTAKVRR